MGRKGGGVAEAENVEKLALADVAIICIGPEGSGKSELTRRLAEDIGLPRLSTGDILRDFAADKESRWCAVCQDMFSNSRYLEAELLLEIVEERLSGEDMAGGFILDGGLRTLDETKGFKEMLLRAGRGMAVVVIHLDVPREVSMERLVSGENARRRDGDTEGGVSSRLVKYHLALEERLAVIDGNEGWARVFVDGTAGRDEVYLAVCERLFGAMER